ncbi:MAG: cytochrome b N-terminal domain-containing protein [Chloroflexi bacterium]|nr:cytochrome b N-terminal domain-containing protein [Chloroflexota bacterium]
MAQRVREWVDERINLSPLVEAFLYRKVPGGVGWWYTLGSATLFLFILQVVTGAYLTMYYVPTPDHAYNSILFMTNDVAFGSVIRGIHHWSASGIVVMTVAHGLRTFFFAAYKYPRELTWVVGVVLLLLVLGLGFTGYLLPWDQKAYWATVVGTSIAGTVPFVGEFITRAMRGGADVGPLTLERFFSAHVVLLTGAIIILIVIHIGMVVRQGISAPPKDEEA